VLREEDIENIISSYRERKDIERYSHVAPILEIQENDYNLNISRYIDNLEEEEIIDINLLASEIKKIDMDM
jgi:type I restriction enzyme M protein